MHIVLTVGRVLLVLIFILSGATMLLDPQVAATQIAPFVVVPDFLSDAVTKVQELSDACHQIAAAAKAQEHLVA